MDPEQAFKYTNKHKILSLRRQLSDDHFPQLARTATSVKYIVCHLTNIRKWKDAYCKSMNPHNIHLRELSSELCAINFA